MDGAPKAPGEQREQRRSRQAAAVALARERRAGHDQTLVFSSRHFIGFGLPVARPPREQREHTVSNGHGSLTVMAPPSTGLPFGQDRLFIVWLASAFIASGKPKDNTIRFDAVGNILAAFGQGLHDAGPEYARLRARILRLFNSTFVWTYPTAPGQLHEQRGQLMQKINLSFLQGPAHRYPALSQSIILDPAWADDIRKGHTVPYDLETITALRRFPVTLDLYLWQCWRSWRLARKRNAEPVEVPIFGDGGLLAQFGLQFARERKARELLRRHQSRIFALWSECPNQFDRACEKFIVRPGIAVQPTRAFVSLPGVRPAPLHLQEREVDLSGPGQLFATRGTPEKAEA